MVPSAFLAVTVKLPAAPALMVVGKPFRSRLGAGVLLTVPGFVTDAVGLALLVPPVRRGVAALMRRRWSRRAPTITATYHGAIIDVGATEPDVATDIGERPPPPPQELPGP